MKLIVRLCVGMALASLFASPALADEGLYLRLGAGSGLVDEEIFASIEFESGYVGFAAVGYNWFFPESIADLRMEIEASYRYNDVDLLAGQPSGGQSQVFSAMLNGYLDVRTTWPVVPYFGAGLGAAQIRYEDDGAGGLLLTTDDVDTVFAYQVMGGINYDLSDNLAVGAEYRFFQTESFELSNSAGGVFSDIYDNHSVMLTLTLGF